MAATYDIEQATVRKVSKRLLPFFFFFFFIEMLDRVNVGFAALQRIADLGFSDFFFVL